MDGRVCRVVYPEGVALLRSSVPGSAGRETRAATTDEARGGSRTSTTSLRKGLLSGLGQSERNYRLIGGRLAALMRFPATSVIPVSRSEGSDCHAQNDRPFCQTSFKTRVADSYCPTSRILLLSFHDGAAQAASAKDLAGVPKILSSTRRPESLPCRFTLPCGRSNNLVPATRPIYAVALRRAAPRFRRKYEAMKALGRALSDAKYKKVHSFRKRGLLEQRALQKGGR